MRYPKLISMITYLAIWDVLQFAIANCGSYRSICGNVSKPIPYIEIYKYIEITNHGDRYCYILIFRKNNLTNIVNVFCLMDYYNNSMLKI